MDNNCNRRLFSIPSKVEMTEEQEYFDILCWEWSNNPGSLRIFRFSVYLIEVFQSRNKLLRVYNHRQIDQFWGKQKFWLESSADFYIACR